MLVKQFTLLSKKYRWLCVIGLICVFSALISLVPLVVQTPPTQRQAIPLALSVTGTLQKAGLDPNRDLLDAASYDTRPCAKQPSSDNCNHKYPVSPPHIDPRLANEQGAGACLDKNSAVVEEQVLEPGSSDPLYNGTLRLWWSPTCQSYFAELALSFPKEQIQRVSTRVVQDNDTGLVLWWDKINQSPPLFTNIQQSGPLPGNQLSSQVLYSPLIYSPTNPVSAEIDLQLADGTIYAATTSFYSAGKYQFSNYPQ